MINKIVDLNPDPSSFWKNEKAYKTWTIALYEREDLIEFTENENNNIKIELENFTKKTNCRGQKLT